MTHADFLHLMHLLLWQYSASLLTLFVVWGILCHLIFSKKWDKRK